jgi:hypothetical protein
MKLLGVQNSKLQQNWTNQALSIGVVVNSDGV